MTAKKKKDTGLKKAEKGKEKKEGKLLDNDLNGVSGGNLGDMPRDPKVEIPEDIDP